MKALPIGIAAASLLLSIAAFAPAESAGAYPIDIDPGLPTVCRDLAVAYRAVASANQSSPGIAKAETLYRNAAAGCKTSPRASIRKLQVALHLVTPLQ